MKKLLLLLFISTLIVGIDAQSKKLDLSSIKIGSIEGKYTKVVDIEKNDTSYYLYLGFQNEKYKAIVDIKSLFFTNQDDLIEFIKDLKLAMSEMENKVSMNWDRKLYRLDLYDFTNYLYISESSSKSNGYTSLNKKNLNKLILWLETIQFGKV